MTISSESTLTTLSRMLGDLWESTTTSAGNAGGTTLIDTTLKALPNANINDHTYIRITSGACDGEERKVSSLDNSSGTLTILATSAQIASSVTYEMHRLFKAIEKRDALIQAARLAFPYIHTNIKTDAFRAGNWLKNASFEYWAAATAPDHWTRSACTCTQTSTAKLSQTGSYSCKLSSTAGYIEQSWSDNDDLKMLRGQSVTFYGRGSSDTASSLRLAILDGTTTTYSSYAPTGGAWDDENTTWSVTATIASTATNVSFRVYHDSAAATDYIDDVYVVAGEYTKVDVSDLNLALDKPLIMDYCIGDSANENNWLPLRSFDVKPSEQAVYIKKYIPAGSPLRIEGIGYCDFQVNGVTSTSWTATVSLNEPQIQILTTRAALFLYAQMAMPNYTTGDNAAALQAIEFWKTEYADRVNRFRMPIPSARIDWGI